MAASENTNDQNAPEGQAPDIDNASDQVRTAQTNQGDTVRGSWPFSLDTIRKNITYMSPDAKELLVWAFTWCLDGEHPIRREEFADRVGYSSNAIYKIYAGKYKHAETGQLMDAPTKLLRAIRDFRRLELARAKLGRQNFIFTPTVKQIYWAIEQARRSRRPLMIYGGSQIGKTEAFKQNCIDFNHGKTVLVEIEAINGQRGLVQAIAVKLGISPKGNTATLTDRIKGAITSDMVIILDEVHLLANVYRRGSFFSCMEWIRRLWDMTKCGLVLSYTDLGYSSTEEERKRELLQIFRRGVLKVNLGSQPKAADVRAIVQASGLDWADRHEEVRVTKSVVETPFAALKQLAADNGLSAIIERIRMANEIAADDERKEITWLDFLKAHFAIAKTGMQPENDWEEGGAA
jgi:DNA transposition AAA+ family ATPase